MATGQKYKPYSNFDQRFGTWSPENYDYTPSQMPDPNIMRRFFEMEQLKQGPGGIAPGQQERFGDPTKVISGLPFYFG